MPAMPHMGPLRDRAERSRSGCSRGAHLLRQDADEHARLGAEPLLDVAGHPKGDEDPVLAAIGVEDGRLEVGPIFHQRRIPGEGGAVLASHVHRDMSVVGDAPGFEARPLGREVNRALVEPAPGRYRARLARRAVCGEVDVAGLREDGAHLDGKLRGHGVTGGETCVGTVSILPLPHFAPGVVGRWPAFAFPNGAMRQGCEIRSRRTDEDLASPRAHHRGGPRRRRHSLALARDHSRPEEPCPPIVTPIALSSWVAAALSPRPIPPPRWLVSASSSREAMPWTRRWPWARP